MGTEPRPARAWVGVDWATQEHEVCALDPSGATLGKRSFKHSGTGLAELCAWLLKYGDGDPSSVRVAIEVPHGAVVETLLERGFTVFAINPKQLDRFRDRFSVAGAKDDRLDARVLADSLRTDTHCFRALRVNEPALVRLREWSRIVDELSQERVRLGNQIREQLRRYYPQFLELNQDVLAPWLLDLWEAAPSPEAAKKVRRPRVDALLRKHRIRKVTGGGALDTLRQRPVVVSPGTAEAAVDHLTVLVARARLLNQQYGEALKQLDVRTAAVGEPSGKENEQGQRIEQRDVEILRSLPGVGRIVLATLLAEASQPLCARDYHALRSLTGVAPVTRRSGKSCVVLMRQACHGRLRHAVYHWSRVASICDPVSSAKYKALRQRGQTHGRALRSVADRLLGVACAMLRSGTTYDPARRDLLRTGERVTEAA